MNRNLIPGVLIVILAGCVGVYPATNSRPNSTAGRPPVEFPFYVSKQGNVINHDIKIKEYRSYYIAFIFEAKTEPEYFRLLSVLGDGSIKPDGTPGNPGIEIPVHIKISKLDTKKLLYDQTVDTYGIFTTEHHNKNILARPARKIIAINLSPGVYNIEITTIKDNPVLTGYSSYLLIEPHFQLRFMPHSVKVDIDG